jgi:DNA-binding transcriptional MerR regulator
MEDGDVITIGRLAAYAGVTIKAVRHYTKRGLLEEPARDSSGYRRYGARHAIELVKIKTLADAGVPLARVKELLAADPDQFAAAIGEIDRALKEKAAEIERARARMALLRTDALFVSAEVARYLDRLAGLGISRRQIESERDIWILLHAVAPDEARAWVADKIEALGDPEFRAIYRATDDAYGWEADDPRLPDLARRSREWLAARPPLPMPADPSIAQLVTAQPGASSPAWDRLAALMRG